MRNYSYFIIASGQVAGIPTSLVAADNNELQAWLDTLDTRDPQQMALPPTPVWMPNSKEYFQNWINGSIQGQAMSFGALQKPFFFLESPRGTGKFEFPGFPTITFGTK